MHAYQIEPAAKADPQRIAEIERERAAMRRAQCGGIIVPASDPDHGEVVTGILGRLSADAVPVRRRLSGPERRVHDIEAFGESYVLIAETAFPNMYRGA